MKQLGIFDESNRLAKLSKLGDSLEKLNAVINWEIFRETIDSALTTESLRYNVIDKNTSTQTKGVIYMTTLYNNNTFFCKLKNLFFNIFSEET